jgi:hypothetical protein
VPSARSAGTVVSDPMSPLARPAAGPRHPRLVHGAQGRRHDQAQGPPDRLVRRVAEDGLGRLVPRQDAVVPVGADDGVGRQRRDRLEPLAAGRVPPGHPAGVEPVHGEAGEVAQRLPRAGVEAGAGRRVEDAQAADGVPFGRDERGAGVEDEPRLARHEGRVGEAGVGAGVGHDEDLAAQERVRAEHVAPVRVAEVDAHADPERHPLGRDEGQEGDGGLEDAGRQPHDVVEVGPKGLVEDGVAVEGREAPDLVGGQGPGRRGPHAPAVTPARPPRGGNAQGGAGGPRRGSGHGA